MKTTPAFAAAAALISCARAGYLSPTTRKDPIAARHARRESSAIDCTGASQDMSPTKQRFCASCTVRASIGVSTSECFKLHREIEIEETTKIQPFRLDNTESRHDPFEAGLTKHPGEERPVTIVTAWYGICALDPVEEMLPAQRQYCDKCKDGSTASARVCKELLDKYVDEDAQAFPEDDIEYRDATVESDPTKDTNTKFQGLCNLEPGQTPSKVRNQYCKLCQIDFHRDLSGHGVRCRKLAEQLEDEDEYGIVLPPFDETPDLYSAMPASGDACQSLCVRAPGSKLVTAWDPWCESHCGGLDYN
ncbi:hypothetical protein DOTSEDRAFT_24318 [Dothistroma septosporum NZE10]|uniref:Uncharacterized protein n=1 Tax=Dothistroma septosporum (strain NZE10 / CBS 128990) TaxID=675120 RepID=N1PL76_DOTSN|nr:hypothetical protein DOTSEDRAFT_24318 [Dothistroma septosporum NZE10]